MIYRGRLGVLRLDPTHPSCAVSSCSDGWENTCVPACSCLQYYVFFAWWINPSSWIIASSQYEGLLRSNRSRIYVCIKCVEHQCAHFENHFWLLFLSPLGLKPFDVNLPNIIYSNWTINSCSLNRDRKTNRKACHDVVIEDTIYKPIQVSSCSQTALGLSLYMKGVSVQGITHKLTPVRYQRQQITTAVRLHAQVG